MSSSKFVFLQQPPELPPTGTQWDMWSALATVIATVVALALPLWLHFREVKHRRDEAAAAAAAAAQAMIDSLKLRTETVGPLIASDAMRVQWDLFTIIRGLAGLMAYELPSRSLHYAKAYQRKELQVRLRPGAHLLPADAEHLVPTVRQNLAALQAQVAVLNAMLYRLYHGPFDPYQHRIGIIRAQLLHVATQVGDTNETLLALMEQLRPYLPPDLYRLEESMRRNPQGFAVRIQSIRDRHQQENTPDSSGDIG